jgi:DNA polymerase-1
MEKLVLVDGMALIFKAFFAFMRNPLSTSKGEPTSAVYGFLTQLLKIIEDTKPDYLGVALDSKEPTFRHEIFPAYKSNRDVIPEDLIPQIERVQQFIRAFNIPIFRLPGYEADDIIGTILKKTAKDGLLSYAITPDKDYMQIVEDNIFIVKPGKSTEDLSLYDEDKVVEEYGFKPIYMIDYLALVGDQSDFIPGVKGIGPVAAKELIQNYGTIENIYANIQNISKKGIVQKLIEGKDNAYLSKTLSRINLEVPITYNIEELKFSNPNYAELNRLFEELELKSLFKKVEKIYKNENIEVHSYTNENTGIESEDGSAFTSFGEFDKNKVTYKLITNFEEAQNLAQKLQLIDLFVFDTETDSLDRFELNLAGVSFCYEPNVAFYISVKPPFQQKDLFSDNADYEGLEISEFIGLFKSIFENDKIKKVCQNAKFDIAVLEKYSIFVKGLEFDTMLAAYVLDPDQKHNMDDLSRTYLNYSPIPLTALLGNKKSAEKIFEVDPKLLSDYSCEDADVTFRLYKVLENQIANTKPEFIARNIEFPLIDVLLDMEKTGVNIDTSALNELSCLMEQDLKELIKKIYEFAGEEFNINSTQQLQQILFNKLNLNPVRKTKTGYSTDAQSLEQLRGEHPIIDLLSDYREIAKLKSTYVDALPKLINRSTKRVHTTFNQTVASTGRLSSLNPNLQNIPVRGDLGKEIRKAFIPKPGNVLICADYNQIELRIMASICQDPNLMTAFTTGIDIHTRTAELIFGVSASEINKDMRRKAKEVNFGILYGIGAFGLKNRLQISQTQAKEIIDNYFLTFPNVKQFMEDMIAFAQKNGFSETILGRRRYLKNINSQNKTLRQFEERVAINMPIQGTAADMIKLAMINIFEEFNKRSLKSKMILQVHDELIFDTFEDEIEIVKLIVKEKMENAIALNVPIEASIGIGKNWLESH